MMNCTASSMEIVSSRGGWREVEIRKHSKVTRSARMTDGEDSIAVLPSTRSDAKQARRGCHARTVEGERRVCKRW